MYESKNQLVVRNITKALKNPFIALTILWRRMFPFGIVPKDPEAYRIGSWSYGSLQRVPVTDVFKGIENIEVRVLNAFARDPLTSMDFQEVSILSSIMRFIQAKNILEIGTFDGNTTLNIAANTSADAKITTVDLPPDWNEKTEKYAIDVPDLFINVTDRNITGSQYKADAELSKKITQVFGDSAKLDWSQFPVPFDAIVVDGCHHYNYVKADTANALRCLRKGGVIFWHDYGMMDDVSRAVDETSKEIKVFAIRGTRLAVGFKE